MDLDRLTDFDLTAPGPLSDLARARGLRTFRAAAGYVRDLPYRRTTAGTEPSAVLTEECGTCSSKHAVLAGLAHEQGRYEIELMLGIYEMTGRNTPGVGRELDAAGLTCVPEAHCYLRFRGARIDLTGLPAGPESPFDSLLSEEVVDPTRLLMEKAHRHRAFIEQWSAQRKLDPNHVWSTREECIRVLQESTTAQSG